MQWRLTNLITSSPNVYTIQSAADPQPYLTYALAMLQPNSPPSAIHNYPVIQVSNCSVPLTFTIEQIKTGANGY